MVHWHGMRVQREGIRDYGLQAIRFYINRLVFLHLQKNVEGVQTMAQSRDTATKSGMGVNKHFSGSNTKTLAIP